MFYNEALDYSERVCSEGEGLFSRACTYVRGRELAC